MKNLKKIGAIALAMVLALALCAPAFASAATQRHTITINMGDKTGTFEGQVFSAYKIFNVTYNESGNYAYTIADKFASFSYTVGEKTYSGEGLVTYLGTLQNDPDALNKFTTAVKAFVESASAPVAADGTATGTVAKSLTIDVTTAGEGYYVVFGDLKGTGNDQTIATCILDTTNPSIDINVKNEVPTGDKKIVTGENQTAETNSASVGDYVQFEYKTKVPNMNGYEKFLFVVNDTMSKGLTFVNNAQHPVTVKVGSKTLTVTTDHKETAGEKYYVTSEVGTDSTAIKFVFVNFIQYKELADDDVVITYWAQVNKDAVIGGSGNTNDAKLVYTNDPSKTTNGDPENPNEPGTTDPTGETPKSTTTTYVAGLKLSKTDGTTGLPLTGAEFKISGDGVKMVKKTVETFTEAADGTYYKLKDGTYTTTVPGSKITVNGEEKTVDEKLYASIETKYTKTTSEDWVNVDMAATEVTIAVNDEGILEVKGLGAGTYKIVETKAPDGYNLAKDVYTLVITFDENTKSFSATLKKGENGTAEEISLNDAIAEFEFPNFSGTQLPSTGGIGTTIFYVAGGVLVLGAVILLVTRKRVNGEV